MSYSKILPISFIAILVVALGVFYSQKPDVTLTKKNNIVVEKSNVLKKLINVDGMTCVGCEVTVEKSLKNIKGVIKSKASFKDGSVVVEFDRSQTDMDKVKTAIAQKGYRVK